MKSKWTHRKLQIEALRYNTRTEFQMGSKGAYLVAYRKKILDKICTHMKPVRRWTKKLVRLEALKYKTRSEFQNSSGGAYMYALNAGILDWTCFHMPKHVDQSGENNPAFRWSCEDLIAELKKYSTRRELREKNYAAYMAAVKRDDFDKMCSHMPPVCNKAYTKEELQTIISQYKTRTELALGNPSVHVIACKRDDYEEMCKHMAPASGPSIAERELFSIIKSVYPNAKKFRDNRVKIKNRPYIKGFEIDILVGKLGIEFDGKYWHSFKKMRADPRKSEWTDNSIRRYHPIKDSWFASKGIKILHIKEEDWKLDKEACIKRCLEFLGA